MNKYGAKKTTIGGITFDSIAEARRYCQLLVLARSNAIRGLSRQVSFDLCPSVKFKGAARAKPALRYVADFVYWTATGCPTMIVEDAKSPHLRNNPVFRIKMHLLKLEHGIEVVLV